MRRRVLGILTVLSLLLWAAAIALWVRSRAVANVAWGQLRSGRVVSVRSVRGSLSIVVTDGWPAGAFPRITSDSVPAAEYSQGRGSSGIIGAGVPGGSGCPTVTGPALRGRRT